MRFTRLAWIFCLTGAGPAAAAEPARDWDPVELTGTASGWRPIRDWRSYYWRDDFTFLLNEDGTGKVWRVISREPTPNYDYRMGTTYTGLKVDWAASPRVKVVGVKAIDRIPADFHDLKLDEPNIVTTLLLFVEPAPDTWTEYYVNNWFHKWGDRADKAILARYAGKKVPYDIYGFVDGQAAPFAPASREVIERHKGRYTTFHGLVRATKGNPLGYEIELIDLIGKDPKTGGHTVLYGDAKTIPLLDKTPPRK
jgi:hypothetical protein